MVMKDVIKAVDPSPSLMLSVGRHLSMNVCLLRAVTCMQTGASLPVFTFLSVFAWTPLHLNACNCLLL